MLQCTFCGAVLPEFFPMKEIADQALRSYELIGEMDFAVVAQSREKIIRYIDKLASAGHTDPRQLAEYASAYLKELHEGPDRRFTGC
jgi:hypothetical protein